MKRKLRMLAVCLVLLIICFAYAHVNKMHGVFDPDVDPSQYVATNIDSSQEYSESFVAEENALDGVAVKFNTTGEEIDKVELSYTISNLEGEVLREGVLTGDEFRNQKYNKLPFDRIEDTKGKEFVLRCSLKNNDEKNGVSFQFEGENMVMKYYMFRFDIETFAIAVFFCLYVFCFMKILFKMFKE